MQLTRCRVVPIILSAFLALPALLAAQEPVTITGKVTSDAGVALGQVEVAIPALGLGALRLTLRNWFIPAQGQAEVVLRRLTIQRQAR